MCWGRETFTAVLLAATALGEKVSLGAGLDLFWCTLGPVVFCLCFCGETMQFTSRYRCLSLQASNGLWYKMNDMAVDGCGIDRVLRQQAYLLFYVR